MFHVSFSFRSLCALSLVLSLAVGPAAAAPSQYQQQRPDPQPQVQQQQVPAMIDSLPEQGDRPAVSQYLRYAPRLLELGYSQQVVDLLFSSMPAARAIIPLRFPYNAQLEEYLSQPHFCSTLFSRYLTYAQANPELAPADVVTKVNIGLDRGAYTSTHRIDCPGAVNVLVNKYRFLGSTFVPELVRMDSQYANYSSACMEPTAYEWFTRMVDDARQEGLWLYCVSAYRSYSYQNTLYQSYVRKSGRALAETYSARPGYSEHQTGLAVDINTASRSAHFENTKQYRWLVENSWKYGFILRYPEGKQDITGFVFEPWHYRYVGQELAKAVYESGLTYDEYVASLPCESASAAQALTVQGRPQTLQRAPLRLDGTYYLAADDLAAVLGLSYTQLTQDSAAISSPSAVLTLSQHQTQCTLNGAVHTLSCAPFVQDGHLLLPLADVTQLMGLSLQASDHTLALSLSVPPQSVLSAG